MRWHRMVLLRYPSVTVLRNFPQSWRRCCSVRWTDDESKYGGFCESRFVPLSAEQYLYLPNNSNIVLAAEQARELLEGERRVTVIPSKSIPQGMAAAFAFQEDETAEINT